MKLKTVTNVFLDGVTQGHRRIDVEVPGKADAPGEYGGFERFTRLFPAAGSDIGLELVDLQSNGLTIQTYRHAGRPQYESETT